MIRIARGPEPEELRRERRRRLARAYLAFLGSRPVDFDGYQCAKKVLYERQHRKCAYCERHTGFGSQPVEHFRPKDGAWRNLSRTPCVLEEDYYWWLAWTWENLLFSCSTCNGRDNKGNHFPLEDGTHPLPLPPRAESLALPAECFDLSRESPRLVDPAREDPMEHIRWLPINAGVGVPEEKLAWAPMHRTDRGHATVHTLGLLGDIRDHVNDYILRCVWPRIRTLRRHMQEERGDLVRSEWEAMTVDLLHPAALYAAACHDALDYFVPAARRRDWGLPLTRPGSIEAPIPSTDLPDPEGFQHLPARLQWRIRADEESLECLLLEVCSVREWTVDELATVLGRSPGYVAQVVRTLRQDGRLVPVPDTEPQQLKAAP